MRKAHALITLAAALFSCANLRDQTSLAGQGNEALLEAIDQPKDLGNYIAQEIRLTQGSRHETPKECLKSGFYHLVLDLVVREKALTIIILES